MWHADIIHVTVIRLSDVELRGKDGHGYPENRSRNNATGQEIIVGRGERRHALAYMPPRDRLPCLLSSSPPSREISWEISPDDERKEFKGGYKGRMTRGRSREGFVKTPGNRQDPIHATWAIDSWGVRNAGTRSGMKARQCRSYRVPRSIDSTPSTHLGRKE